MARIAPKSRKKCFVVANLSEMAKERIRRDVCKTLPATYLHEGKSFCVLHCPNSDKLEVFNNEIHNRLSNEEYNYENCYFPSDIDFSHVSFNKPFYFMGATFAGKVRFMGNFEEELDFRGALFDKESQLIFQHAGLRGGLDLRNAIIRGHLSFEGGEYMNSEDGKLVDVLQLIFEGDRAWLDLQNLIIEKPERVLFHTVRLQPNWFVNVDCRKFVFTDCRWVTADGKKLDTLDELDGAYMKNGFLFPTNPNALLTKTCLQLAENYESNKDYETSSLFWKIANESKRFEEYWGFKIWSLHWWYWLLSFYGESWRRAALCLVVLVSLFACGYVSSFSHFVNPNKQTLVIEEDASETDKQLMKLAEEASGYRLLGWTEAFIYSLRVGALQRPDPQPGNNVAKGLVALETIFVPLQVALLALAIRRKFMR